MMPVVRISDAAFVNLKSISTWFGTKTPGDTIERVVQEVMERLGLERDDEADRPLDSTSSVMQFNSAPGLAFTKPLSATIDGKSVPSPRWASILLTMVAHLKARGLDGERLVHELGVPAKAARFEEEGFRYHPDLGISIQGQSASEAWKEVERLARKWQIPVSVEFWWRQNPKAQYPGKTGILRAGQSQEQPQLR